MLKLPDVAVVLLTIFTALFFLLVAFFLYVIGKELLRKRKSYQDTKSTRRLAIESRKAYNQLLGSVKAYPQTVQTRPIYHYDIHWVEKRGSQMSLLSNNELNDRKVVFDEHINYVASRMRKSDINKSEPKKTLKSVDDDVFLYAHSAYLAEQETAYKEEDHLVNFDQANTALSFSSSDEGFSPGLLEFSLYYSSEKSELILEVKQALYLQKFNGNVDDFITSFVMFCFVPEDFSWQQTKVVRNSSNPSFRQKFTFSDILYHRLREYSVVFFIMELNSMENGIDRPFGKLVYPLTDLPRNSWKTLIKELKIM